jgi:hypothetical protein
MNLRYVKVFANTKTDEDTLVGLVRGRATRERSDRGASRGGEQNLQGLGGPNPALFRLK